MSAKLRLDKYLQLWKQELIREEIDNIHDNVLSWAILGPKAYRRGGNRTAIIREINRANKIESSLIKLCKTFKFNVRDPKYVPFPPPPKSTFIGPTSSFKLEYGQLSKDVALGLISAFYQNRNHKIELRKNLNKVTDENKTKKFGQFKTPEFFAYHLIVGLDLFKGSGNHLKKLKEYIETGSEFEKWITDKIEVVGLSAEQKKTVLGLFIQEKSIQGVTLWRSSKRQAMISSLFVDKSKKATKLRGQDEEKNKIEAEVVRRLENFKKRVSSI